MTLEPCSHHGQTPPCTDAIIAAGVGRVVYAIDDPDPRACGAGRTILTDAGIEVTRGVLAEEARRAHLGHFLRVTRGRPMVTLKLALTADFYAAGCRPVRVSWSREERRTGLSMSCAPCTTPSWWALAPFWRMIPC